jgi:mono/diheme cytochrome c family protein
MHWRWKVALAISTSLTISCSSAKQSADKNTGTTGAGSEEIINAETTYYAGYDGTTDYSILLPDFRKYALADQSVAKLEEITVTLSDELLNELVAQSKAKNPNFDEEKFKKRFKRERTSFKITPLKAGTLYVATSGGRGGPPGTGQSGFPVSKNIRIVVKQYTAQDLELGKARYETDGGGSLQSCKSCHESADSSAPPHELGRIMQISDSEASSWLTTGKVNGREAKVAHSWEFNSDAELQGVVAYLRSKQTRDIETLTKLYFEEHLANDQGIKPGPKP